MRSRLVVVLFSVLLAVPLTVLVVAAVFGNRPPEERALALMGDAEALLNDGRTEEALERLREGIRTAPDFIDVHRRYQGVLRKLGRLDEALAEYRRRLDERPDDASAHYLYGRLLEGEAMEAELRAALVLDDTLWWAHAGLGHYLYDKGDYQNSVPHLGLAHAKLGRKDLLYRLAMAYMHQGNMEAAIQEWEQFKAAYPSDPAGWFRQGCAFLDIGQPKFAYDMIRQALILDDGDAQIHAKYVETLIDLKRFGEAEAALKTARDRGPGAKPPAAGEAPTVRFLIAEGCLGYLQLFPAKHEEVIEVRTKEGAGSARLRLSDEGVFELSAAGTVKEYPRRPSLQELIDDLRAALKK